MTRTVFLIQLLLLASLAAPLWAADFDHAAHLEFYVSDANDCSFCHAPDADSIIPDTDICLSCHDAELVEATSLAEPMTHGPVWALNHGSEAKNNTNNCAACHQQSDCLDCHQAGFADQMGDFSNNMINVHRSDFSVSHPIAARTDQQLCASCHEPQFCTDCHDDWRFKNEDIGSPSHRRSFDLGFADADVDAIHAGLDNSLACDSCHSETTVDFHTWSIGHAREARRSLATCQSCHPEGDVCLNCHSARSGAVGFNPHPEDWSDIKGNLEDASNGRTCRRCH